MIESIIQHYVLIIIFSFLLMVYGVLYCARKDNIVRWNKGRHICGKKWHQFTNDEYPKGYMCDQCNEIIWINFKVDKP